MARLVVKIKYMKPSAKRKMGKYAKYISTREGVAKIDDSHRMEPETDSEGTELQPTTYADYIATRPRAERNGKHGLFTDETVEVNLENVSRELNSFEGTMWIAIISLRREDAEKLGFDNGARWRNLLRAHRDELASAFRIQPSNFMWYGAFHDEGYHPHIHMIIYDKTNHGYLSQDSLENIKSMFAHAIFQDEMLMLEREKSDKRDQLRLRGKDEIEEIISRIQNGTNENVVLQAMLLDLARRLRAHNGKKYYTYLKKDDKRLVVSIVDEIAKIPAVDELYNLWYEKQEALSRIYKTDIPPRIPLSSNPVFKPIRNHVIKAAGEIALDDEENEVIDIGCSGVEKHLPTHESESDSRRIVMDKRYQAGNVALSVTRLLNNVGYIFRNQFSDNPKHSAKVDRKIWMKIREKEEAHGMKHG